MQLLFAERSCIIQAQCNVTPGPPVKRCSVRSIFQIAVPGRREAPDDTVNERGQAKPLADARGFVMRRWRTT